MTKSNEKENKVHTYAFPHMHVCLFMHTHAERDDAIAMHKK